MESLTLIKKLQTVSDYFKSNVVISASPVTATEHLGKTIIIMLD